MTNKPSQDFRRENEAGEKTSWATNLLQSWPVKTIFAALKECAVITNYGRERKKKHILFVEQIKRNLDPKSVINSVTLGGRRKTTTQRVGALKKGEREREQGMVGVGVDLKCLNIFLVKVLNHKVAEYVLALNPVNRETLFLGGGFFKRDSLASNWRASLHWRLTSRRCVMDRINGSRNKNFI